VTRAPTAVDADRMQSDPAPSVDVRDPAGRGSISRLVRVLVVAFGCLASLAQITRALFVVDDAQLQSWYLGLGALTVLLFVLAIVRTPRSRWAMHGLLATQCLVVLIMVLLTRGTEVDFMTSLYVPLAAEAALVFVGRAVWIWVGVLGALTTVPLMAIQGLLEGLAVAPMSLAPEVVFAAFVVVARDLEAARRESQVMLDDLRAAGVKLEAYAAQAGELAAVAERDRVARELNDSVAARIGEILSAAEAARGVLAASPCRAEEDGAVGGPAAGDAAARQASGAGQPGDAAALVASIQAGTQRALAEMRGLIAELRPAAGP
jgi:signal transduction histidine kinase